MGISWEGGDVAGTGLAVIGNCSWAVRVQASTTASSALLCPLAGSDSGESGGLRTSASSMLFSCTADAGPTEIAAVLGAELRLLVLDPGHTGTRLRSFLEWNSITAACISRRAASSVAVILTTDPNLRYLKQR